LISFTFAFTGDVLATESTEEHGIKKSLVFSFRVLPRWIPWQKNPYLLTLYAKVQLYPWQVFGLRGVDLSGSALRGDFPVLTSVFLPRLFPNTAARQFRILTGFPIPDAEIYYIWYVTKDLNTIYMIFGRDKAKKQKPPMGSGHPGN